MESYETTERGSNLSEEKTRIQLELERAIRIDTQIEIQIIVLHRKVKMISMKILGIAV